MPCRSAQSPTFVTQSTSGCDCAGVLSGERPPPLRDRSRPVLGSAGPRSSPPSAPGRRVREGWRGTRRATVAAIRSTSLSIRGTRGRRFESRLADTWKGPELLRNPLGRLGSRRCLRRTRLATTARTRGCPGSVGSGPGARTPSDPSWEYSPATSENPGVSASTSSHRRSPAMKLKRLFQVLVLGGTSLIAACGGSNGSSSNNSVPPPHSLLPDGGTPPTGYNGPTIW